jgi:hypothetical protein
LALAIGPGDFFNQDGMAAAAIDAPHGVEQKDEKAPEGDELEAPLRELIVSRRRLMAAGTPGGRAFARAHRDLDALGIGSEAGVVVNETRETMASV